MYDYVPTDSIIDMARDMIRTPSQAGIDDYRDIIKVTSTHLKRIGLAPTIINSHTKSRKRKHPCAIVCEVNGDNSGPVWLLNATIDTAAAGEIKGWSHDPFGAIVENGRLYGRGSADSKTCAAIFAHVAALLDNFRHRMCGRILLAFDLDEHTGKFTGISSVLEKYKNDINGAFIGYSGSRNIYVGARGFARFAIGVNGKSEHSGNRKAPKSDALMHAMDFVRELEKQEVPEDESFYHDPQFRVTHISAGESGDYCRTPGSARIEVDFRLTPEFSKGAAKNILNKVSCKLQEKAGVKGRYSISSVSWAPAYRLSPKDMMVTQLQESVKMITGKTVDTAVSSKSNIGNLLSNHGIGAICGYGVTGNGVHEKNESCEIKSIAPVFRVYANALSKLTGMNVRVPSMEGPA
jgi:succinyl-diaminopimelate desuccinylase